MMDKVVSTSTPAIAVDLTDTKQRLVLDDDFADNDAMITAMANTATQLCEAYSGHQFMQRTLRFYFDDVATIILLYDAHPCIEVTAIKYLDVNGDEQTLSADNYTVDLFADPVQIKITETPTIQPDVPNAFYIDVLVGYGSSGIDADAQRAALPAWAVQAINAQVGSMYEQREDKIFAVGATAGNGTLIKASEYIMHPFKRHW